ncbi:hypothetical protein [Algibacter pectinivorans]|uniref:DUF7793 domain-containing protein n=1 Tax=Algibacter pectinivorans TaxID=870482 RepID=A0A1I1MI78_9FLAO|nr:hypothetical protein [Algibacter pectinivorans]SFC84836.1 hypothetical protein SAMN04487987_101269 [Algibacter pectinivorans]
MENNKKCNKAKFWLDQDILFCKFKKGQCTKKFREEFSEDYVKTISSLSGDSYFPLLVDLRALKAKQAFAVIQVIANNSELRSVILCKSFVVRSLYIRFVLLALGGIYDPIIPNKIYKNYNKAISYSLETNQFFNALS